MTTCFQKPAYGQAQRTNSLVEEEEFVKVQGVAAVCEENKVVELRCAVGFAAVRLVDFRNVHDPSLHVLSSTSLRLNTPGSSVVITAAHPQQEEET